MQAEFPIINGFSDIEPSHVHRYVATYRIGPLYVHRVLIGLVILSPLGCSFVHTGTSCPYRIVPLYLRDWFFVLYHGPHRIGPLYI